jgi:hypothetical protein
VFLLALLAIPIQDFGRSAELAPLVHSLGLDEVAGNAEGAALALIAMGEPAHAPLFVALSDADPQQRALAADCLKIISRIEANEDLAEILIWPWFRALWGRTGTRVGR